MSTMNGKFSTLAFLRFYTQFYDKFVQFSYCRMLQGEGKEMSEEN